MQVISQILLLKLFGAELINGSDFLELIIRFSFNLLINIIIIRYIYYRTTNRKNYLFTYILISISVFFICYLLENVKLELGFALGLFAIFGIIRYRTMPIPIREMTYLFVIIGVSVINALANKKISYAELVFTNVAIVFIVWGLERLWLLKHESSKRITYEKIELIKPENHQLLKEDLEKRTGLKITRIEIGSINFLRDTAKVIIYYYNNKVISTDELIENQYDENL